MAERGAQPKWKTTRRGSVRLALALCALTALAVMVAFVGTVAWTNWQGWKGWIGLGGTPQASGSGRTKYVLIVTDGTTYVYSLAMLRGSPSPIAAIRLPNATTRGVVVCTNPQSAYDGWMYIDFRDPAPSLLAYDLNHKAIEWVVHYQHNVDSAAITPDCRHIYMPDESADGRWYVEDPGTGRDEGFVLGGARPHDGIVSLDGRWLYMGGEGSPFLYIASTSNTQAVRRVGPFANFVRPFVINREQTYAFVSVTGLLGFEVADLRSGRVVYHVPVAGFHTAGAHETDPSHGIALTPDETQLYVLDSTNDYVHVFDVSGLARGIAPLQIADIRLAAPIAEGWLNMTLDGAYAFVGEEGDVIAVPDQEIVAHLAPLARTKIYLEVDFGTGGWYGGRVEATSTRFGLGYG